MRYSKKGMISFIITIAMISYWIIVPLIEIFVPGAFNIKFAFISTIIMTVVALINFILAVIAMFERETKKVLVIISLVISGILLLPAIVGYIKGIILRLSM